MIINAAAEKKIHEGRNIKRIREMLGIKQETLAAELELSQQSVSLLEQKEVLEPALLEQVAKVLKVPAEAIRNFSEEMAINFISNTFRDYAIANFASYNPTFNPLDKVVELYERLLQSEREKIDLLKK